MIIGFTGTREGMTHRQRETVHYLFVELQIAVLHHGCCIGADYQAHKLALRMRARSVGHPPKNTIKLAPVDGCDMRPPYNYLTRNWHIVREGVDGLIAAPSSKIEPDNLRGQGTWTTINYARKEKRRLWIVYPDGTFIEENAPTLLCECGCGMKTADVRIEFNHPEDYRYERG